MNEWICLHLHDGCDLHIQKSAVVAFTKSDGIDGSGTYIYCIGMTQFLVRETVDELRALLGVKA
jgi:hypothetical protein